MPIPIQQIIKTGQVANDGTGDPLPVAGSKINANFDELWDQAFTELPADLDALSQRVDGTASPADVAAEQAARIADVNTVRAGDLNPGVIPSSKLKTTTDADKIQLGNLGSSVTAALAGGLDPEDYLGQITALNQALPPAGGSTGKWYSLMVAGLLSGTNAPAITVEVGDRLLSNGTLWQLYKAPPAVIPDLSLTEPKYGAGSVSGRAVAPGSIDNTKLTGMVPPLAVGPNTANIEYAITDRLGQVVLGVRTDATIVNPQLEATVVKAAAALPTIAVAGNPQNIEFAFTDRDGKVMLGFRTDGTAMLPQQDARLTALELGGSANTLDCIPFYGQSNSHGAVDYDQSWRTPMAFGTYPPGFAGTVDGAEDLTLAATGNNRTLNSAMTALVPLAGNGFGIFGSSDAMQAMLDTIVTAYPTKNLVSFCHGVGGALLAYLDKPTSAEITAGSANGITIGPTSAEYLMQTAGQTMASISSYAYAACATPYYKGMWITAKLKALAALESKVFRVPAVVWSQGESDLFNPNYNKDLLALYDTYRADVVAITQQTSPMYMIIEAMNYSAQLEIVGQAGYDAWSGSGYLPAFDIGGASSQYTPEASRVNSYAALNGYQLAACVDGPEMSPARLVVLAGPRYFQGGRIHMAPHEHRAMGELYGKVFRKLVYEGKTWPAFRPLSWWISGTSVFIRFHVPKGPLQFALTHYITTHVLKTGKPYGLEHSAGAIQQANVVITGPDIIRITPDVAPLSGHTIGYVQSCRFGSICDSDQTTPLYTNRAGGPNVLRNYCVPFLITL